MLLKVRGHLFKGGFDRLELTKSPFLRHWILTLIDGHIHAMMRAVGQAGLNMPNSSSSDGKSAFRTI
jgi:hypothetical protein